MEHQFFTQYCLKDLKVNKEKAKSDDERSTVLATAYFMIHGYTAGFELALESVESGISVKELSITKGGLTSDQATKLFDPLLLTNVNKLHALIEQYKNLWDV